MNKPPYGNSIRNLNPLASFAVSALPTPSNIVAINPGVYISGAGNIIEYSGGNSPTLTPPVSGILWTLLTLGTNANITVTTSTTTPPAVPKNNLPLALVYQRSTDSAISSDMIFDIRPLYTNTSYTLAHSDITSTSASDCHPISAITGLTTALNDKLSIVDSNNNLANKADIDGTASSTFTLNKNLTGTPSADVSFVIERGSAANVSFKFNETTDKWQFTNDGSTFFDFSNAGNVPNATTLLLGRVLVSYAPVDANNPIAVGDNDPRIVAVATKAPIASPTFTGTVSGITAAMVGLGNVDNTSDVNKPVSTAQLTALNLKANLASPTFTGTVSGITKTMVGLANVDNTSDVNKPISTAVQSALDLKAVIASPTFTGTVSGITASMVGLGNVSNVTQLPNTQVLAITGDATAPSTALNTGTIALTLTNTGVTLGTYKSVTVDAKGRVTGGTNPTTLSGYGITDALNLSGGTLTGALVLAADPTLALHPATKQYVDNFVTGLDVKVSVRAISTSNITLSGTQTIDGVALIAGDRVLVAGQTTQTANGIYVVAAGAWSRATDADNTGSTSEVSSGMYTFVEAGTANASTGWVLNTPNPITLGSSNLTFTQFTGLGEITAGAGLTKTGATISVSGGVSGSFTSANAKTITVTNGIITAIV